jgi:hypothetical protein
MASYVLSIKPYAIRLEKRTTSAIVRFLLQRTSRQASKQLQRLRRRLSTVSPWYDASEHGDTFVMWS